MNLIMVVLHYLPNLKLIYVIVVICNNFNVEKHFGDHFKGRIYSRYSGIIFKGWYTLHDIFFALNLRKH